MKAATHKLVDMEIERSPEPVRDQEAYRRARLPAIYAEHEMEWRAAYMAKHSITINEFVSMVCGFKVEASAVARSKMERNMEHIRHLPPINVERNLAGIARCREVLRECPSTS
jgi:hypothetical protein